jgi:hypothetical protein
MNGLAREQRKYDRPVLDCVHVSGVEFDKELHLPRFTAASLTDTDVEQFIAELVAAPNMTIFFENRLGLMACDYWLEIAVARQWVADKEAVGSTIGPVFWRWARNCAIEAAA